MTRRKLITMSVASAIMVTAIGVHAPSVEAKSLNLSSKNVTLTVGKSKTIKVRGAKKVTWKVTSGRKVIRLSAKTRTSVKITAKKTGSAKVQAKAENKKISCKVTVKSSKSRKTTVLNVTKVDKATVKKVHETLSQGNKLKIRIKGGTESQRLKARTKLGDKVSKYNEYGVRPQLSLSECNNKKGYSEWKADSELAGQYKWGLLLVKDIVEEYKKDEIWQCSEEAALGTGYNSLRDEFAEQYVEGSLNYNDIFKEVTGVTPEIYKECQTKKTSKVQYLYRFGENGSKGLCSSNPGITEIKDWYYATDKDGNLIEGRIATDNTIALGVEDFFDYKEKNEGNPNSISYYKYVGDINNYMLRTGAVWKIPYSDVVFHYEPFKADAMDKVNSEIQKAINEEVAKDKAEREAEINKLKQNDQVFTKKFCNLSSAVQQWCIQEIMGGLGEYTAYDYKYAWGHKTGVMPATNKRSGGRIHCDGGGAEGLRLAYQCKWMGVCSNYANLEMTIYKLYGLYGTKISCHECDHAWTAVKLTNSKGKTFYAKNNYGLGYLGYTSMPSDCIEHNRNTGIKTYYLDVETFDPDYVTG